MPGMKFKTKIALIFFVSYMLLSGYIVGLFYQKAVLTRKEQLRQNLMQLSDLGTKVVGAELVDRIAPEAASMEGAEYRELVNRLSEVMKIHGKIEDVYVLVATGTPGMMKFLGNADSVDVVACGEEYDVTRFPELEKAFEGPSADREIASDRWGDWLSGYAPIRRPNGTIAGILGIDVSAKTVKEMYDLIKKNVAGLFLISVIFALGAGKVVSWWLSKPVDSITKGINEISAGNLDYRVEMHTRDEFGKVADNINKMAAELKQYIKDLTETTKEKERLNRELEIAAELQEALLPHYKLDVQEIDLAGLSLPARQVGGDYFDYMNRDGRNIGFVIADAAGKGLPGSIFMTNSRSIFKVITTEETSPAEVIRRTNDMIIENISSSAAMFVTLFYGIYDREKKVFRYSNAGHNPPLFVRGADAAVIELKAHGCPIGIIKGQEYGEDEITLTAGDMVVLYTDGVIEAMNAGREMFGMERFVEVLLRNRQATAQDILNEVKRDVFAFTKVPAQSDDLTLLIFKMK